MAKKKFYSEPPTSRFKKAEPVGYDPIYKKGDRVYRPSPDGMVLDTIEKTRTMDGVITYDVKNGMGTYVAPELKPTNNITLYSNPDKEPMKQSKSKSSTQKQKAARSHFRKMVDKAKKERKKNEPFSKAMKRVHRKMK